MSGLLTTEDVARLLHLHPKRVQAYARAGRLPAVRVGRRWLFPGDKLANAVQSPDLSPGFAPLLEIVRTARSDRRKRRTADAPDEARLEISARNQLRGRVAGITFGGVMAEVRVRIGDQELVSIITRSSAERLRLAVGDDVVAVIKSTEVMLGRA